jgi:predicted transcriptional regulator
MKKNKELNLFRVGSISYWTSDKTKVIISKRKHKILLFLDNPKLTSQVARYLRINWKAAYNRLVELDKLALVKKEKHLWYKIQSDKEVLIL